MTMQSEPHGQSVNDNVGTQLTLLAIALLVVVVIAWYFVF